MTRPDAVRGLAAGALLLLAALAASCSARYSPFFIGWREWSPAGLETADDSAVARLDWSRHPGVVKSLDGVVLGDGYKKARLAPGHHRLEVADHPVEIDARPAGVMELDLDAGAVAEIRIDYCFRCTPGRHAVWLEDRSSGETLRGEKPDWPGWMP
jgi:hypothetical protein